MSAVKELLRSGYYLVRGGGKRELVHKREYHRLRAAAERRILAEAQQDPSLFAPNRCPACGVVHEHPDRFSNPLGFQFATCPETGTVYMDPVPTEGTLGRLYNDPAYAFHWTEQRTTDNVSVEPANQHDFDHLVSVFRFPTDRRPTLLDVGCATGAFLLTARQRFDVEGVELGADTAEVARKQGLQVTTGRLQDVSGEGRFDVITMLQLIEHITDPAELLTEARRLLRPGGIVYLDTPNVDSASFRLFGNLHTHVSSFGHVSLFTKAGLARLAERVGLKQIAHAHCGGIDIQLHDLLTSRFTPGRFRHRMALYSPRFYHASDLLDRLSGGLVRRAMTPPGNESYQWAALQKPPAEAGS
ncbi:MAG: class I SAM-dependent methyltransferase [Pirellulales bacterium]|nr:class I SAM-dependent methyltransferase [Pirellulales bacterium]